MLSPVHYPDIPDSPGTPQITNVDAKSIGITWSQPKSDGGSPITGYVIEKRNKTSTNWTKAFNGITEDTDFTIGDLEEGEEYEFRVATVNKVGQGSFSEASPFTFCKAPYSKY